MWAAEEILGEVAQKILKTYPSAPLKVSVPDAPVFVPMDPILIEQVLFNLAENSILHGDRLTYLEMTVKEADGYAVFSVEDDGGGFDREILDKLKDDSMTLSWNKDTDKKRGMGIGLRVCKAIIRAHDGDFRFENTPDGSMASFALPLS